MLKEGLRPSNVPIVGGKSANHARDHLLNFVQDAKQILTVFTHALIMITSRPQGSIIVRSVPFRCSPATTGTVTNSTVRVLFAVESFVHHIATHVIFARNFFVIHVVIMILPASKM
jgi:hypothetical protein